MRPLLLRSLIALAVSVLGFVARADVTAPPDLEAMLKRTKDINGGESGKTLEQTLRALKDVNAQRAAVSYVLAIVDGDAEAFAKLFPDGGLVIDDQVHKKKTRLTRDKAVAQAAQKTKDGKPSFLGVMGDIADGKPSDASWSAEINKKKLLEISANGAFAWATLKKQADGSWRIDRVTLSENND